MTNKIEIKPSHHEVNYNGSYLTIDDCDTEINIAIDWEVAEKIASDYINGLDDKERTDKVLMILKTLPDEKQEKIWESIYDSPSYQKLEQKNYILQSEIEELRNSYNSKNDQYQNLKYRR